MRLLAGIFALVALAGCGALRQTLDGRDGDRLRLWNQAFQAMDQDSFRVAAAAFQRLAADFPESAEGHEARFFLGVLSLEPLSAVSLEQAEQHFSIYLAADSTRGQHGYHGREAESLLRAVRALQQPCEQRGPGFPCTVRTVAQTDTVTRTAPSADATAEIGRLRREINERDRTIRELREELQRLRNTLAPPRPR